MKLNRILAQALRGCAVVTLALAAGACVLIPVPSGGGKGGGGDVTLCHKGKKTMTLPREAADGHMGHGDRVGAC
jgi:hypothetical protein